MGLRVLGTFAQQFAGTEGFLLVSLLGGLFSGASSIVAAALAATGIVSINVAATGAIVATITSVLSNLPFIRRTSDRGLKAKLVTTTAVVTMAGTAAAFVSLRMVPFG